MITVADLVAYRRRHEKLVERVVATELCRPRSAISSPSATARWSTTSTTSRSSRARSTGADDVLVRVHSECLTGDVFHSLRCDCGEQLESALAMIEQRGPRRAAVPEPGGARDRPAQQAARLQAPGGGPRHRRRQPPPRPARRPARLRDRRPDPRRPRADQHPHPHQQPEEDLRPGRLRAVGHRPDPDPARAEPPQRGLPARQARPARATRCTTRASRSTRRCSTTSRSTTGAASASGRSAMAAERRVALCVARFYAELAEQLEDGRPGGARRGRDRRRRPLRRARARSSCRWSPSTPPSRAATTRSSASAR